MITLTLLHPSQSTPVQSWLFDSETVVRLGRGNQNDVVLYSAVVSRRHAELQNFESKWELINFGANGTYIDGKSITQARVVDGMIIRLGESGPKLLIGLGANDPAKLGKVVNRRSPSTSDPNPSVERNTLLNLKNLSVNNHPDIPTNLE
ncbi:FHA domain-containing protein [Spirulina subsalsa FACHB-351]|uniref:FHA domain-containing protein n=1 Tax=Spirulina subsalsa FACHB-351 TaxID=234711 RepID=A0ABT3L8X3_9CYAN|nr:FHA domain-containing protein [Spirulina subsalsa]MCW6037602.1 FHA domain-containing protein [Spirulina subsalsa FACHB-351]